jgi:hypothetical protein
MLREAINKWAAPLKPYEEVFVMQPNGVISEHSLPAMPPVHGMRMRDWCASSKEGLSQLSWSLRNQGSNGALSRLARR